MKKVFTQSRKVNLKLVKEKARDLALLNKWQLVSPKPK